MICYQDKTWCEFYKDCFFERSCSNKLTPQIRRDAVKWWGSPEAPIMVHADKPKCFKQKDDK